MTAVLRVPGERLADVLARPPDDLPAVEVVAPPPPSWAPLKPPLVHLVRAYRARGAVPPSFGGVPLCLFGSEWAGFPSRARTTPARGRCAACAARDACDFDAEVPAELAPISAAPVLERWRDYAVAFRAVTGSAAATAATPLLARILAAYRGPVSVEPSVLLSDAVEPAARVVVFPHRVAPGAAGEAECRAVLAAVRALLAEIGADPASGLIQALESLPPVPIPVGIEERAGSWSLKLYLRLEEKTPAEKEAVVAAVARGGVAPDPVPPMALQMLGLVLDDRGLATVKAYIAARPSMRGPAGFPPPLPPDHPLVALGGDAALATLDVWCRDARRANKWDVNLRDHYLAGAAAERLAAALAPRAAARLGPLLAGPSYRADVVAVGVRGATTALYMELD